MDNPTVPAEVSLAAILAALEYCEENFVHLESAPGGRWFMRVWNDEEQRACSGAGVSFLDAYNELREDAGDSPFGG